MSARCILIAVVLLLAAAPVVAQTTAPDSTATTHAGVTVILATGWTYKNVAVTLVDDGQMLEIARADGATQLLDVREVAAIRDAQGADITELVIPGAEARSLGSLGSQFGGREEVGRPALPGPTLPRPFDVALTANLGFGFPFGEFYDSLDPGLLYGMDLRITTSARNYVKVSYRSQNVYKNTFDIYDPFNDVFTSVDASLDVRQYLVMFGVLAPLNKNRAARGFTEFGLGYGDHVASASAGSESDSTNLGRLLISVQGGAMFPFGPQSKVGAEISGFLTAATIGDGEDGGFGFLFGMQVGLVVMFGGDE